ncbi:MAG: helix-turn-helix transcriptional regulator, partial [Mesorhizobium sp.]
DEAMLPAVDGKLSPIVTGLIYCNLIAACRQVYALDRSREWTEALSNWCGTQPQLVQFNGVCLLHRAEIMELNGAWQDAIAEARRATTSLAHTTASEAAAGAAYQEAEIHRLRGEFAAAEDLYRTASRLGLEPQPGMALLRLAQGRAEQAAATLRRVLATTKAPLGRARLLPALVE